MASRGDDGCRRCGWRGTENKYLSLLLGIEILMEKYPPTASLSGYPNIALLHSAFLASQRLITKIASRVYTRYRKAESHEPSF